MAGVSPQMDVGRDCSPCLGGCRGLPPPCKIARDGGAPRSRSVPTLAVCRRFHTSPAKCNPRLPLEHHLTLNSGDNVVVPSRINKAPVYTSGAITAAPVSC